MAPFLAQPVYVLFACLLGFSHLLLSDFISFSLLIYFLTNLSFENGPALFPGRMS